MATMTIQEYDELAQDSNGQPIPAGVEPAIASQVVSFTSSSQSALLNKRTRFVLITVSAAARIQVGANPTAATASSGLRLPTDGSIFIGVRLGTEGGLKIAAVAE